MLSNCGHDERNSYAGGAAGDQGKAYGVGEEWGIIPYYSRPWDCVLRHPDAEVRALHSSMARAAALNDNIGYDQWERDTFGESLKAAGDDPAKITKKCETDCSKGIIDITKAIGRKLGRPELANIQATYTGNMRAAYKAAGYQVLTGSKYTASATYLLEGDILLNEAHHVATNLDDGGGAANETGSGAVNTSGNLKKGSKGEAVKTMQKMLIAVGYSCGSCGADGDFGNDTRAALVAFQKAKHLTVDGIYGPASKSALEATYAATQKTTGGVNQKADPKGVWDYLLKKIGNPYGVAGAMGNLYKESGLLPNNLEDLCEKRLKEAGKPYYTDELYTIAVDNGTIGAAEFMNPLPGKQYGYGLAQWTSPGRKSGLYSVCKTKGVSISNQEAQLEWLYTELSKTYASVLKTLQNAKSVREASDAFLLKFEVPADTSESVKAARAAAGQKYYDLYAKASGSQQQAAQEARTYKAGDAVKVDGTIYGNGNGTGGSITYHGVTMYVTELVDSKTYKHYIGLARTKGGARMGWGSPDVIK